MNQKIDSAKELETLIKLASKKYSWYFWSQNPDKTVKEVTGININYKIKAKDVELVQENISHGVYPLQDVVKAAKKTGQDVIALDVSEKVPRVMVERFSSFKDLYVREIGLYSKTRPWLIDETKKETLGIKVLHDGYPRSSDKTTDGDLRNEKELFHKSHPKEHRCKLNKDGRVLKHYRKTINIEPKEYICDEQDLAFIKELISE